jgi:hypothetical protein
MYPQGFNNHLLMSSTTGVSVCRADMVVTDLFCAAVSAPLFCFRKQALAGKLKIRKFEITK